MIECSLEGTIPTANKNFLSLLEYSLDEVQGKHHRIFVSPEDSKSAEYEKFWQDLGNGVASEVRELASQAGESASKINTVVAHNHNLIAELSEEINKLRSS